MYIEIHGTGAHNAGAELMAHAIRQWSEQFGEHVRCAADEGYGTYDQRAQAQLATTFSPGRWTRSGVASLLFSNHFLRTYGIVPAGIVDAVLDASGYAYGDRWETPAKCSLLRHARAWKGQGRKVVLLPQSFGPFDNPDWKGVLQAAAHHVDLIFARDTTSYDALRQMDLQTELHQAPDFTVGVHGYLPVGNCVDNETALVVPNQRVRDKGEDRTGDDYLQFLVSATEILRRRQLKVMALSHSSGDDELINDWQSKSREPVKVIRERHPLIIKGLLSVPKLVVGSRFHALASAMLQQVPCIGVGWSHKYSHLFEDFGATEMLLHARASRDEIEAAIDRAVTASTRAPLLDRLYEGARRYAQGTEVMWTKVQKCLSLN